jgi:hypothetical protein
VGGNVVLESASGEIGTESAPVLIDQSSGSSLVVRAQTGVVVSTLENQVSGRSTDIRVGSAYSPNTLHLISKQGSILDNAWQGAGSVENGWGTDVKAANVHLTAATSIGLMPAAGDPIGTVRGKALEIANVEKLDNSGNATQFVVLDGDLTAGVNVMTPLTESVRYTSVIAAGDVRLDTQRDITVDGRVRSNSGNVYISASNSYGVVSTLNLSGNMESTQGAIQITNQFGNVNLGVDSKPLAISSDSGQLSVVAQGAFDVDLPRDQQIGDIRMSQGSSVDMGSGRISLDAGAGLYFSNLKTSSTASAAVTLRGFDVMDNSGGVNDPADITLRSNGGLSLKSYRYTDINRIDYQGSEALHIQATGATTNVTSAAAAIALGINANNAAISFDNLYSGYAAISVKGTSGVSVGDGRITRTAYFDLNGLLGRVGDIDYPGIDYAVWTRDAGGSAFQNAAMPNGQRRQDFVITGSAATAGLSILKFNLDVGLSGSRPTVNSDGFLLSYERSRVSYVSPSGEDASIDSKLSLVSVLGQNLPILQSIGLKIDFNSAQVIMSKPVSGLGFQKIVTAPSEDGNGSDTNGDKKPFPANFPPSILDAETSLDSLNLTALDASSSSVQ